MKETSYTMLFVRESRVISCPMLMMYSSEQKSAEDAARDKAKREAVGNLLYNIRIPTYMNS